MEMYPWNFFCRKSSPNLSPSFFVLSFSCRMSDLSLVDRAEAAPMAGCQKTAQNSPAESAKRAGAESGGRNSMLDENRKGTGKFHYRSI